MTRNCKIYIQISKMAMRFFKVQKLQWQYAASAYKETRQIQKSIHRKASSIVILAQTQISKYVCMMIGQ